MPVRVMLGQLTSSEITELRAYHEILREPRDEEGLQPLDDQPTRTPAEVEAHIKKLMTRRKT